MYVCFHSLSLWLWFCFGPFLADIDFVLLLLPQGACICFASSSHVSGSTYILPADPSLTPTLGTVPEEASPVTSVGCNFKIAPMALHATASWISHNQSPGLPAGGTRCYSRVNKRVYQHQSHWCRQFITCEDHPPKALLIRCKTCVCPSRLGTRRKLISVHDCHKRDIR
jgi:hypothetical protein